MAEASLCPREHCQTAPGGPAPVQGWASETTHLMKGKKLCPRATAARERVVSMRDAKVSEGDVAGLEWESSPWGGRSSRAKLWWTDRNPISCPTPILLLTAWWGGGKEKWKWRWKQERREVVLRSVFLSSLISTKLIFWLKTVLLVMLNGAFILTHRLLTCFPCPAKEESDRVALVGSWCPARVNTSQPQKQLPEISQRGDNLSSL